MTHQVSIVATIGPSSFSLARQLLEAGATGFRLNGSHMTSTELHSAVQRVRSDAPSARIVVDLQGAKMRLGSFEPVTVVLGTELEFTVDGEHDSISIPHPELFRVLEKEDVLRCDDDRLRFEVVVVQGTRFRARAMQPGVLRPRKGVALLDHPVALDDATASDIAQMQAVGEMENVAFACSYMADGTEAQWIRKRSEGRVVGKIERLEAIRHLAEIEQQVDELWICRGDLGAQLGVSELARWLSFYNPRNQKIDVWIAGQVFEHLTSHSMPTRSEVCHYHDLLQRGYRGLVLSDETAIGIDPVNAVSQVAQLTREFATNAE